MKQITLSSAQLIEFGAPIAIHKEDSIQSADDIFTFEISRWNDNLTVFRQSAPLQLSLEAAKYGEYDREFRPQGVFCGRAVKMKRPSEKGVSFSLAVYDKGSDNNTLWVNCWAGGKTGEIMEQYASGINVAVSGDFKIEEHETFGTTLKLFVKKFTLLGGGSDKASTAPAKAKVDTEEIPF